MSVPVSRRGFLAATGGLLAAGPISRSPLSAAELAAPATGDLAGGLGITTSSLSGHLVAEPEQGQISLLELPRFMRDELDMRVIDLNDGAPASWEPAYLEQCREAAEKAGCVFINMKMNRKGLDMNSPDEQVRRHAIYQYKQTIDGAARLGCRWARPLPLRQRPDMAIHVASYRELAEHAATHGMQMLIENYGWMQADPASVPALIKAIDRNVAACPDTGNWDSDELRREGLKQTFPLAVTCDFKARPLGPHGEHALYDLRECFEIGWQAGFRGPWCFEHANRDRAALVRELGMLRDMLRRWMAEKNG